MLQLIIYLKLFSYFGRLEMGSEESDAQCPCGHKLNNSSDYNILYLKKEMREIDLLCPNSVCYLGELGFIKFEIKDNQAHLDHARFYSPYVTWNATRMGEEKAMELLKSHLKELITEKINWRQIIDDSLKMEISETQLDIKEDVIND